MYRRLSSRMTSGTITMRRATTATTSINCRVVIRVSRMAWSSVRPALPVRGRFATRQAEKEGRRHRTERLKPKEEWAASGAMSTDQEDDRQHVRHRQGTQGQVNAPLVIKNILMARKEGPYRHEVECCDSNGDHDPGDSEAGRFHGNRNPSTVMKTTRTPRQFSSDPFGRPSGKLVKLLQDALLDRPAAGINYADKTYDRASTAPATQPERFRPTFPVPSASRGRP